MTMTSDTHGFTQAEWDWMPQMFKDDYASIDKAIAREQFQVKRDRQRRGKRTKKR